MTEYAFNAKRDRSLAPEPREKEKNQTLINAPKPNPEKIVKSTPVKSEEIQTEEKTDKKDSGNIWDSPNTIVFLWRMLKQNIKNIPNYIKRNLIAIITMSIIWLILMVWPTYRLPKIFMILVFLSAAYNNWVAKIMYYIVMTRTIIPMIKKIKKDGPKDILDNIMKTPRIILENFKARGVAAHTVIIIFTGIAIAVSNYLMRNNKIDKYFICLMVGFGLYKAMSEGPKSVPFSFGRIVTRDIFRLMVKESPFDNKLLYVAIAGLAIGFSAGALAISLFCRNFGNLSDYAGYITGGVLIFIGIMYGVINGKGKALNAKNT